MNDKRLLNQFQINVLDKNSCQEHFHLEIELIYILEGTMTLQVEDQKFEMKSEDIIVVNANKRHSYTSFQGSLFCEMKIPYEIMSEALDNSRIFIWCNSTLDQNKEYDALRVILRKMLNRYVRKTVDNHSFGQMGLFYTLLEIISVHFMISSKDKVSGEDKYDDRIEFINNYIRSKYNQSVSLNELARQLYLSNAYLSRFFKVNYGMNFVDYLTNIRLFHAVDELLYSDYSITRIALDNGFSNATLFNKAFKKLYGETPTVFRNKSREEKTEAENRISINVQEKLENYLSQDRSEDIENYIKTSVDVIADAENAKSYVQNWNQMINVGVASDLLEAGMQEHVLLLKKKFGFPYIRVWNIFSDKMLLQIDSEDGIYNFRKIDIVLDFLVENEIRPFLDLGQNPKAVRGNLTSVVLQEGEVHTLMELSQCKMIISAFFKHVMQRYGREVVQTWKIELWDGSQGEGQTENQLISYLQTFTIVYKMIKELLPDIEVGGCGSTALFNKSMFLKSLKIWREYAPMPDFFSIKVFGYIKGEEDKDIFAKRTTDPDFLAHSLQQIWEEFKKNNFPIEKLYVTEWNQSLSDRNYINDSCYKGASNMKNIIQSIGETDMLGYYIGSDRFSEYYDTRGMLHGGLGILTKDSILKPVGYSFAFMNQLYKQYIEKSDQYLITTDGHNSYGIACHNCKKLNYYYYLTNEDGVSKEKIWQYFEEYDAMDFNFTINNVKDGMYQVKIQQINEKYGSVLDQWKEMDYYDSTSKEIIKYFQRVSQPKISFMKIEAKDRSLNIKIRLAANEIAFIGIENLM